MTTRKFKAYVHKISTGCLSHFIVGVAAAALLGIGAHHVGLPRLATFALVVVVVIGVSVLLPRPRRMSDLYTPSAKRVIFFARDEALQRGNPHIGSEHLLLGVLRENKYVTDRLGGSKDAITEFGRRMESITTVGQPLARTVEIPLSRDSKQILRFAVEEAESLGQQNICIGHLLLGMLRAEQSTAARILESGGATIAGLREKAARDMRWAEVTD